MGHKAARPNFRKGGLSNRLEKHYLSGDFDYWARLFLGGPFLFDEKIMVLVPIEPCHKKKYFLEFAKSLAFLVFLKQETFWQKRQPTRGRGAITKFGI
jgi:hypothetical protein